MVGLDTLVCGAVMSAAPLALPLDYQSEGVKEVAVAVHAYDLDTFDVAGRIADVDGIFLPYGFTLYLDTVTYDESSNYWWGQYYQDSIVLPPLSYALMNGIPEGKYLPGHLNVYVLPYLETYVSGFSYIPPYMNGNERHHADGVWIRGDFFGTSTLVHEIGHWFGLYHVFQDVDFCGSDADLHDNEGHIFGDLVHDTPPIKPSWSCVNPTCTYSFPEFRPWYGFQPNNYMDYLPDTCRDFFTFGQVQRMHSYMTVYRADEFTDLEALQGDINGDGIIGTLDILFLLTCLDAPYEGCEDADIDLNGIITVFDLLVILSNYGL